ncbi:hypothetical protein L5515_016676 [Caenorhabditis briggsae]|uniref:F-box domain-containing protein n=1 Tax=Caenorhabditis briggsae TaxID=6238 RepID=A0AAE9F6N2_CAEBR|nr:hypothetical protein L5515_016676 [Caenorhabditis briggsae]
MPIDFIRFPELVQKKILDLLECYDLYNFSETSKWSRSLSIRPAKRHKGQMEVKFSKKKYLELTYSSSSHPHEDLKISLELKDSKFEDLEKYLSVRHSTLFANVTISLFYSCSAPFDSAFLTLNPLLKLAQLGYSMEKCSMCGVKNNEAIVRTLTAFRKEKDVQMSFRPTKDFKNFDFVTPFSGSLENEQLQIDYTKWVSVWHIFNVFNKCRFVYLGGHFPLSDVFEILKNWKAESSIRSLELKFQAWSNEEFAAKMVEMNAAPVQEAPERRKGYTSSSWMLNYLRVVQLPFPLDNP